MTKTELLQLQNEHRERNYEDEYYNTPFKTEFHGDLCIVRERRILFDVGGMSVTLEGGVLYIRMQMTDTTDPNEAEELSMKLTDMHDLYYTLTKVGKLCTFDHKWDMSASKEGQFLTFRNRRCNRKITIGLWTIDELLGRAAF